MFVPNVSKAVMECVVLFGKDILIETISYMHMNTSGKSDIASFYGMLCDATSVHHEELNRRIHKELYDSNSVVYWENNMPDMDVYTTDAMNMYVDETYALYPWYMRGSSYDMYEFAKTFLWRNWKIVLGTLKDEFTIIPIEKEKRCVPDIPADNIRCPEGVVAGALLTKERRHALYGVVAGGKGSRNPEIYQRSQIVIGTGRVCPSTQKRINWRKNLMMDVVHPMRQADGFDYTENFDGNGLLFCKYI